MIKRMSHATIFVNNQNEALEFYRDKLGFKVHTDAMVGDDFRWLTMCTQEEPNFEIILMEPKAGMLMDEETCNLLRAIMAKGVLGAGAFHTDDCRGTYAALKEKGVEFLSEPGGATIWNRNRVSRQLRELVQPHGTLGRPVAGEGHRKTYLSVVI